MLNIRFFLDSPQRSLSQPVQQLIKMIAETGDLVFCRLSVSARKRFAPYLGASFLVQVRKKIGEPGDQIALGKKHVDGKADVQYPMQFLNPPAYFPCMPVALILAALDQIGYAHRYQHAVDRPPRAVLLDQIEESAPGGRIHGLMAVLGGVTPGGIQEYGVFGKKPVSVARSTHPLDTPFTPAVI